MKCYFKNVKSIYIVCYSVGNRFSLWREGTEQAVPDDEHIGIVMVDVFFILTMVNTVVGWRYNNPLKNTQFINVFRMRPETINVSERAHGQDHHWVEAKNG